MKHVLITGKDSYIGTSVEKWLMKEPENYSVETIDMRDDSWREVDFGIYDVVFHVAGIAHVSSDPKLEELYYKVNRDLTIETAKKAKEDGVKQFIFMSSIIVYGDCKKTNGYIDKNTIPSPNNFYGNSKLQAEKGIIELNSDDFKITIIRPPMIYGKGAKGNYLKLSKLAKHIMIFPKFSNKRSMLHIDNLCEFIKITIEQKSEGVFFPQNKEYVNTSSLVETIASNYGKKIIMITIFNPIIKMMLKIGYINKVFGNLTYDKYMNGDFKTKYQIREFEESIKLTEN